MKPGSIVRWLAACVASAGLTGCFPYHQTEVPEASGRVVDARSRRPVVGASVQSAVRDGPATKTNARGAFTLPATKRWIVFIAGMDFSTPCLTVAASGYGSTRVYLPEGEHVELGQPIALSPTPGDKTDASFLPARPAPR